MSKTVNYNVNYGSRKRYGFGSFIFDLIMCFFTAGFWLIWIFIREMRRRG